TVLNRPSALCGRTVQLSTGSYCTIVFTPSMAPGGALRARKLTKLVSGTPSISRSPTSQATSARLIVPAASRRLVARAFKSSFRAGRPRRRRFPLGAAPDLHRGQLGEQSVGDQRMGTHVGVRIGGPDPERLRRLRLQRG